MIELKRASFNSLCKACMKAGYNMDDEYSATELIPNHYYGEPDMEGLAGVDLVNVLEAVIENKRDYRNHGWLIEHSKTGLRVADNWGGTRVYEKND